MSAPLSVGFVGAGSVVQSIHLPALARVTDLFRVGALWDIDAAVAQTVAERAGCRAAASIDALMADPAIDVIAICSPAPLHAEHAIAAMRAGKRAVFVEKPLATSVEDARRVSEAARETGVPLVIGAMHQFDPGWLAVADEVRAMAADARLVRSSIVLPYNRRFLQWAIEGPPRPAPPARTTDRAAQLRYIRSGVLELAIHDLPLVRAMLPEGAPVTVTAARVLRPVGYALTLRAGDRLAELFGYMNYQWAPHWEVEGIADDAVLSVSFTPSFVAAGSAVASVTRGGITRIHQSVGHNGYEGEWRAIARIANGDASAAPAMASLLDDLSFALGIADQACALIEREIAA